MATNLVFDGVLLSPQKPAKVTIGDRSNFSSKLAPTGKFFFQKQQKPNEFLSERSNDVSSVGLRNKLYHQRMREKLRNKSLKPPLQLGKDKKLKREKQFENIFSKSQSFHGITSSHDKNSENNRNLSYKNNEKQSRIPTISMSLLNITKNDTKHKGHSYENSAVDEKSYTKSTVLSKQLHDTFNINNSLINLYIKDPEKKQSRRSSWNLLIHGDSSNFNVEPPPHHNDTLLYKKNMVAHGTFANTTNKASNFTRKQPQHKQKWRSFYQVPNSNTIGKILNSSPVVKHPRNLPPEHLDNQVVSNPSWGEYRDPIPGASRDFFSRMERMSQLQCETVRWEKNKKFKRKK